jgi:hypothetical protein
VTEDKLYCGSYQGSRLDRTSSRRSFITILKFSYNLYSYHLPRWQSVNWHACTYVSNHSVYLFVYTADPLSHLTIFPSERQVRGPPHGLSGIVSRSHLWSTYLKPRSRGVSQPSNTPSTDPTSVQAPPTAWLLRPSPPTSILTSTTHWPVLYLAIQVRSRPSERPPKLFPAYALFHKGHCLMLPIVTFVPASFYGRFGLRSPKYISKSIVSFIMAFLKTFPFLFLYTRRCRHNTSLRDLSPNLPNLTTRLSCLALPCLASTQNARLHLYPSLDCSRGNISNSLIRD